MSRSFAGSLALMVLLWGQISNAQIDPWERVKLIEPGKKVSVKRIGARTVSGRMQSWNPEGLTVLQRGGKVTSVLKKDVKEVAMLGGWSRGERTAVAGLAGGAIGAAIFGAACGSGDCYASAPAVALGGALFVGGIAAAIASLFPQHREVIYSASRAGALTP